MAKAENVSILERHVEKLLLLVCVVLFGYAASRWAMETPVSLKVIGPSGKRIKSNVGPEQVDRMLEQAALSVKDAYDGTVEPVEPVPPVAGNTQKFKQIEPREAEGVDLGLSQLPVETDAYVDDPSGDKPDLAQIQALMPAPAAPTLMAGLELPKQDTLEDKLVARGVVVYPLEKLRTAWMEKVKDTSVGVPFVAVSDVVVEVQQKQADGSWPAEGTVVSTVRLDKAGKPVEVPPVPPFTGQNITAVRDERNKVGEPNLQASILRPEYYRIWDVNRDDWAPWQTKLKQIQFGPGEVAVWFHDEATMALGGTYRYRVRLRLINPLLTYEDAVPSKRKTDAAVLYVETPFSEWSQPAKIRRQVEFFLTGASEMTGQMAVTVYVHKWGQTVSKRFRVVPGEPIGGKTTVNLRDPLGPKGSKRSAEVDFRTGAVAVKFEFGKKMIRRGIPVRTNEMVYQDKDGQLRARVQTFDDSNPRKRKLDENVKRSLGEK
jgi:hypothetical protein